MKSLASACLALGLLSTSAAADATGFLGLSMAFGNGTVSTGVSARMLSNNAANEWAVGGGVSYYFTGETGVGVDVGVARNFTNRAGFVGYDFLRNQPVVSFGLTRTAEEAAEPAAAPAPGIIFICDPVTDPKCFAG